MNYNIIGTIDLQFIAIDMHGNDLQKKAASSLSMTMERWLHKQTAADVKNRNDISTLEIGAGTLNQFNFENTALYDIGHEIVHRN